MMLYYDISNRPSTPMENPTRHAQELANQALNPSAGVFEYLRRTRL
jgi:hypothetical protein